MGLGKSKSRSKSNPEPNPNPNPNANANANANLNPNSIYTQTKKAQIEAISPKEFCNLVTVETEALCIATVVSLLRATLQSTGLCWHAFFL